MAPYNLVLWVDVSCCSSYYSLCSLTLTLACTISTSIFFVRAPGNLRDPWNNTIMTFTINSYYKVHPLVRAQGNHHKLQLFNNTLVTQSSSSSLKIFCFLPCSVQFIYFWHALLYLYFSLTWRCRLFRRGVLHLFAHGTHQEQLDKNVKTSQNPGINLISCL